MIIKTHWQKLLRKRIYAGWLSMKVIAIGREHKSSQTGWFAILITSMIPQRLLFVVYQFSDSEQ